MGGVRRATGRPWLAALMALSLGLVVAVGLWDQSREAEASLVEVEHQQAALATLVASVVTAPRAPARSRGAGATRRCGSSLRRTLHPRRRETWSRSRCRPRAIGGST